MNFNYYMEALRKYAVFSGRARRAEYWTFVLINAAVGIILSIIGALAGDSAALITGAISSLYSLAVLLPSIAVGVRRLHDIGKSGWWLLIVLVPLIGWITLLIFALMNSQPGDNQYGPNPKGMASDTPPTPQMPENPQTPQTPPISGGMPTNTPPTPPSSGAGSPGAPIQQNY